MVVPVEEVFAAAAHELVLRDADVTPPDATGRAFGAATLRLDGKIFGMLVEGGVVVKTPRARVDELVADGAGRPFTGSGGRVMKEWVRVDPPDVATCGAYLDEALAFVRGKAGRGA